MVAVGGAVAAACMARVLARGEGVGMVEETEAVPWAGVAAVKSSEVRSARRRGSDLGRNLKGVW